MATIERASRVLRWLALGAFACVLVRTAWLCDDAFITFRVLDNFSQGHGLRWNVAERVQVYTHPAWMLLLAVPHSVTREIFHTALSVSLALSLAVAVLVAFRVASSAAAGALGLALLASSRAFVDYSTSGLENPLSHLLLVLFALRIGRPVTRTREVWVRSSLAALGMLNRLDLALVFLPALAWSLRHERRRARLAALASGFLPLAIWLAFATLYYGQPFPNPALAKLGAGIRTAELVDHGWRYLQNSWSVDPLTLATIALGLAVAAWTRGPLAALAPGIVIYIVYVVRIGGDFMSGRFLTAPLLCAVAILVAAAPGCRSALVGAASLVAFGAGFFAPYPTLTSGADYGLHRADLLDDHGIADERGYYFWMSGWLNGREGPQPTNPLLTSVRSWMRCGYPIAAEGAVGFVGFVGGPRLHIIDYHGLADPLLARLPAVLRDPLYGAFCESLTGEACRDRFRVGHYLRTIPPGYLAHRLGRRDAIPDPRLAEFVERLDRICRGPLFDRQRLREIVALNLGRYDSLLPREASPEYVPPRWDEVAAALPASGLAYARLANHLAESGDSRAAAGALRRAIDVCPDDADSMVNLAVILWLEGRDPEVLDLCRRALRLDPRNERAYNGLGHVYTRMGQIDEALEAFDRAIELDPTMPEAHAGRARAASLKQLSAAPAPGGTRRSEPAAPPPAGRLP